MKRISAYITMKKTNEVRRCRLCACEESFEGYSNIFEDDSGLELEIKITKLLPVVVMPWDPMPHIVCHECIEKLNSFSDFYETSLKAERFLKTLLPSVPDDELQNVDPVVRVMGSPILEGSALKLPPKKRQGVIATVVQSEEDESQSSLDVIEIVDSPEGGDENRKVEEVSRLALDFIVNHIPSGQSVFTCRHCFKTFTKESSAFAHACVRFENCKELETVEVREGEEEGKSLPPLRLKLFTMESGLFVCYLCQASFEEKTDLLKHLKDETKCESGTGNHNGRRSRGKRAKQIQEEEEDWEEAQRKKPVRRKRKKCTGPPRKRTRSKAGEPCLEDLCKMCGRTPNSSISKETVERMTQYSEASCESKPEIIEVAGNPETTENIQPKATDNNPPETTKNNPPETTKNNQPKATDNNPPEITKNNPPETTKNNPPETTDSNSLETTKHNPPETPINNPPETTDHSPPEKTGREGSVLEELIEIPDGDPKSDEVTVLEVLSNRTETNFSLCEICDKVFSTREGLIGHQNRHLLGKPGLKSELDRGDESFLCCVCAMMFPCRRTLLEHEQCHLTEPELGGVCGGAGQSKIRIALGLEFPQVEQEPKSRGVITITVSSNEKKIPQIEFI